VAREVRAHPRWRGADIEVSDDPELAGFLIRVTDEIFGEEKAGDFRTKSRPDLPGIEGIRPVSSVSMGRGVRVGA